MGMMMLFVVVVGLVLVISMELGARKTALQARISRELNSLRVDEVEDERSGGLRDRWAEALKRVSRGRSRDSDPLGLLLVRAGSDLDAGEVRLLRLLVAVGLCLTGLVVGYLWVGVGLAVVCWLGVGMVVKMKAGKRLGEFCGQLPDALDMISNCLRSGYSLLQAIDFVAGEVPSPMADELERVKREVRVDIPLNQALKDMVVRMPSPDLDLVVTAILIHREVGGNLTEVFDRITLTIRDRVKLHGEIRTLTAQGRVSGLVIGALPVGLAVLLWIMDPGYMMPLFTTTMGQVLVGVGLVMQGMGALIIRKMIRIEV